MKMPLSIRSLPTDSGSRARLALLLAACSLAMTASACGGGSTLGDGNASDDMAASDLTMSTAADMPAAARPDMAGRGDMTPYNHGVQVLADSLQILGLTSDDTAIVSDSNGVEAVALTAGATPTNLDADPTDTVTIRGNVVFVFANGDPNTLIGDLIVYTKAGGAQKLGAKSSQNFVFADPNNAFILYTLNGSTDGTSGDLYLAKSDGSGAKRIYTGVATDSQGCVPSAAFANGKFYVTHCPAPVAVDGGVGDAGAPAPVEATLSVVDAITGVSMDLASHVATVSVDKAGKYALVLGTDDKLSALPLGVGVALPIDSNVGNASISDDGALVVYRTTNDGALKKTALPVVAPVKLVASGCHFIQAISSDFKYVVFSDVVDAQSGIGDLQLAATAAPAAPVMLTAMGITQGDVFTTDGTRVLYYTNVDTTNYVGTFQSRPVVGGAEVTLGSVVYIDHVSTGANVVFNDNFVSLMAGGRADIQLGDAAKGTVKLIAPAGDPDFFITNAKDKVVYSLTDPKASGLYVLPAQ